MEKGCFLSLKSPLFTSINSYSTSFRLKHLFIDLQGPAKISWRPIRAVLRIIKSMNSSTYVQEISNLPLVALTNNIRPLTFLLW